MATMSSSETQPSEPEKTQLDSPKDTGERYQETNLNNEDGNTRKVSGIAWAIAIVALLSSTFLYALDNTIMANVRPSIVETFHRIDMLPWLSVSYPMGEVGSNPLWYVHFLQLSLFRMGLRLAQG